MTGKTDDPATSTGRTICAVCAWRNDCKKKFSFDESGGAKCPDYTRDAAFPPEKE
jgi:hypothetical protein